jgi:hypothetical protein
VIGGDVTTLQNMLICDAAIHIPVAILSARAGIALWNKWPGAVGTAKNFLIIALLLSLLVQLPERVHAGEQHIRQIG